jgi:hypothetical protein
MNTKQRPLSMLEFMPRFARREIDRQRSKAS